MNIANFWLLILIACLVWYSTITVYVSIRGLGDIRSMFARLRALRDEPTHPSADQPPE